MITLGVLIIFAIIGGNVLAYQTFKEGEGSRHTSLFDEYFMGLVFVMDGALAILIMIIIECRLIGF